MFKKILIALSLVINLSVLAGGNNNDEQITPRQSNVCFLKANDTLVSAQSTIGEELSVSTQKINER